MKKTIKIFISSPGDVIAERNKAMQIIKRLNRHYGADVNIEVEGVFWERQPFYAYYCWTEGSPTYKYNNLTYYLIKYLCYSLSKRSEL